MSTEVSADDGSDKNQRAIAGALERIGVDRDSIGFSAPGEKPVNILPLPNSDIYDYTATHGGKKPFTPQEGYVVEMCRPVEVSQMGMQESIADFRLDEAKGEIAPDVLARGLTAVLGDHSQPGEGYDGSKFFKKEYLRHHLRGRLIACLPKSEKSFAEDLDRDAASRPDATDAIRQGMVKGSVLQGMLLDAEPYRYATVYPSVTDRQGRSMEIHLTADPDHPVEERYRMALSVFFQQQKMPARLTPDRENLIVTLPAGQIDAAALRSRFQGFVKALGHHELVDEVERGDRTMRGDASMHEKGGVIRNQLPDEYPEDQQGPPDDRADVKEQKPGRPPRRGWWPFGGGGG